MGLVETGKNISIPLSRYRKAKILRDGEGDEFFETHLFREIEHSEQDLYHEVSLADEYRLDLISYIYYDTPALWWVIAMANGLADPIREVVTGLTLRIPSPNYVFSRVL